MPPLHLQNNLANVPLHQLQQEIETRLASQTWDPMSPNNQQYIFARAMQLQWRPHGTNTQRNLAWRALNRLVEEGAQWNGDPAWTEFLFHNSGSNNASSPQAVRGPNYSKASAAVKKWLAARPHTVHMNVVTIKLPANASDPVSYHNFKPGNEAVMVIKKHLQKNGAMRSKRTFYQKNMIERLAGGKKWRTILRMKGSDPVFKDPLTRATIYRRDLMNVKFRA